MSKQEEEFNNTLSLYSDLYKDRYGKRPCLDPFLDMGFVAGVIALEEAIESLPSFEEIHDQEADEWFEPYDPWDLDDRGDNGTIRGFGPDYWQNDAGEWCCG